MFQSESDLCRPSHNPIVGDVTHGHAMPGTRTFLLKNGAWLFFDVRRETVTSWERVTGHAFPGLRPLAADHLSIIP